MTTDWTKAGWRVVRDGRSKRWLVIRAPIAKMDGDWIDKCGWLHHTAGRARTQAREFNRQVAIGYEKETGWAVQAGK